MDGKRRLTRLLLFTVSSADATFTAWSDHARHSEEGLPRRLANEPRRALLVFGQFFRLIDMSQFSMLSRRGNPSSLGRAPTVAPALFGTRLTAELRLHRWQ